MVPSPEYYINKFLCEQCIFFQRFKLDYHVVNDEGHITPKELQRLFGKCTLLEKHIEGRELGCEKFKKEMNA